MPGVPLRQRLAARLRATSPGRVAVGIPEKSATGYGGAGSDAVPPVGYNVARDRIRVPAPAEPIPHAE
jgi:hypothetical protein